MLNVLALAAEPAISRQALPSPSLFVELANEAKFISVACRSGAAWKVRLAVAASTTGTDYVPADAAETIDAYLASTQYWSTAFGAEEAEALKSLAW